MIRRDFFPSKLPNVKERLKRSGRISVNLWADVFMDGRPPEVRRALAGQAGYEALMTYFYLNEVVVFDEMARAIPLTNSPPADPFQRLEELKKHTDDVQHQCSPEFIQILTPLIVTIDKLGDHQIEFCELGSTFFSSLPKLRVLAYLLGLPTDIRKVRACAIDHSNFFLRASKLFFHEYTVEHFIDFKDWAPTRPHPIHLSRYVASYAMSSANEFADWMRQYSAFQITDMVSDGGQDFTTTNTGLRQVFFALPRLVASLGQAGWNIYLNEITPEFNSGTRCASVKLFGIRKELEARLQICEAVASIPQLASLCPMRQLTEENSRTELQACLERMSDAEWKTYAHYKKDFPLYGGMMSNADTAEKLAFQTSAIRGIDTRIPAEQLHYYLRKELGLDNPG